MQCSPSVRIISYFSTSKHADEQSTGTYICRCSARAGGPRRSYLGSLATCCTASTRQATLHSQPDGSKRTRSSVSWRLHALDKLLKRNRIALFFQIGLHATVLAGANSKPIYLYRSTSVILLSNKCSACKLTRRYNYVAKFSHLRSWFHTTSPSRLIMSTNDLGIPHHAPSRGVYKNLLLFATF